MKEEINKACNLSFLVVGAGAVGGITAALLKKNGFNVEIVCKYDEYASLISEVGVGVKGACGDFKIKIPAFSTIDKVKEKKDVILLATKATDMIEAARSVLDVLKPDGHLVSLQNGLCEDDLASVVGSERVVGCIVGWGATMEEHGKFFMSSEGDFILGYTDRKKDVFLESLASVMSSVVPTRITDNIMGHLYAKLIINSCITSPGAICGLYLGKMLSRRKIRSIFIEIIREAISVADAMKIKVEVFGGKLDFYSFINRKGVFANLKRHIIILLIGFKYRKLKSSSLQSLKKGKPSEVDFLNGYIVRNSISSGTPVPVNVAIVKILHEIESGNRKISELNFEDPVFDIFN